jgi:(S)-2-hydroxy-acid oxidase
MTNTLSAAIDPVCIDDIVEIAKRKVDRNTYHFIASGADGEQTLRDNVEAFGRYRLQPRVLCNVSKITTTTTLLDQPISFPVCVSPTSLQCVAHPDGEAATVRACTLHGTCMVLSSSSTTSIEQVARASKGGLHWFQLYVSEDRELVTSLIRRAETSGYKALVVTIDAPAVGKRLGTMRYKFNLPPHLTLANYTDTHPRDKPSKESTEEEKSSLLDRLSKAFVDSSLSWKDITWLMSITSLPVVVKGVLTAEDARIAVELGVKGILVSNHGARQLDGVPATIEVLKEIVDAVCGKCEVYLDGGVRRGTDVLKALALGARAVFIGRPVLWGLAYKVRLCSEDHNGGIMFIWLYRVLLKHPVPISS